MPPLLCLLGSFAEAQYVASKRPAGSGRPTAPAQLALRLRMGSRSEQGSQGLAFHSSKDADVLSTLPLLLC